MLLKKHTPADDEVWTESSGINAEAVAKVDVSSSPTDLIKHEIKTLH